MRWPYLSVFPLTLLAACQQKVPEIGRDLPSNYAEGEQIFDQRIKARFPAGTDEKQAIEELQGQGFQLSPSMEGVRDATFIRKEAVFQTIWSMRWRANDGKISEVWGVYGVKAP